MNLYDHLTRSELIAELHQFDKRELRARELANSDLDRFELATKILHLEALKRRAEENADAADSFVAAIEDQLPIRRDNRRRWIFRIGEILRFLSQLLDLLQQYRGYYPRR